MAAYLILDIEVTDPVGFELSNRGQTPVVC
ncbi:protein of unknown function [Candidatus Methylomirabilis oxygeniifera]|uniref:Uncharacterized protein n=1 Tax=Methylomirabilis oxygeniifera TaxID=671143 RepID=D5MFL2_METO1|nr:protein of unknown function [Candidatus Methylomirabilis oxyfera]